MEHFIALSALVGTLLTIYFPIYLIFFIVRRIKASKVRPGSGPSIITPFIFLPVILTVFAFVQMQMNEFNLKARAIEARTDLTGIHEAQKAFFKKHNAYAVGDEDESVFYLLDIEGRLKARRYALYCGESLIRPARANVWYPEPGGEWPFTVRPSASGSGFTCLAIGNMDTDEFPDVWITTDREPWRWVIDDVHNDMTEDILVKEAPISKKIREEMELGRQNDKTGLGIVLAVFDAVLILLIVRDQRRYKSAMKKAEQPPPQAPTAS
jgi:hypothetical protein